jgi:hypothetical protein
MEKREGKMANKKLNNNKIKFNLRGARYSLWKMEAFPVARKFFMEV